jgi:hypothetical protein
MRLPLQRCGNFLTKLFSSSHRRAAVLLRKLSGYRANADIKGYFLMVVFLPISASKDPAFLNSAKPHSKNQASECVSLSVFVLRRFLDF